MLTADKVRYAYGVKISEKIIPDDATASKTIASWVLADGKMKPGGIMNPIGITIHNTTDLKNVEDDAEQYTRATWPNQNMKGVVVHYYVDDLGAWQNLRENEPGWHASDGTGNGNRRTIAIEVIMDGTGSAADLKARDNAARLGAYLLDKYNWTLDNVYTHNHWKKQPDYIVAGVAKNCPIYLLPDWNGFKNLLNSYRANSNPLTGVKEPSLSYEDIQIGGVYKFSGTNHYTTASATKGLRASGNRVKVIQKYLKSSKHPIMARSINTTGALVSGVYGWINLEDLSVLDETSYKVKIISTDPLNVRKGPSVAYAVVTTVNKGEIYTITEVSNGWGKLKSGAGWINLSYTSRI